MSEHYCHNCGYWGQLADTVHCSWCLRFFHKHGRMPRPGDDKGE